MITVILGAIMFVGVEICHETGLFGGGEEHFSPPLVIAFVAAYLVLGGSILLTALRNITKGHIFDENFLMAAATLGALQSASIPKP